MADITKCTGLKREEQGIITCPFRKKCWSFLAPSGRWQSWFTEPPLEWQPDGSPFCKYFYDRAIPKSKENHA